MAADIDSFMTAVDRWGDQEGNERDNVFSLVLVSIGRFFDWDSGPANQSADEFFESIQSGALSRRYRVDFERILRSFVQETGVREAFLIVGAVHYVQRFLEENFENTARIRKDAEESIRQHREALADPEEARRAAERQNEHRLPGMPEMTPERIYELLDHMEERYTRPRSLEELKASQREMDSWRSIVLPILQN